MAKGELKEFGELGALNMMTPVAKAAAVVPADDGALTKVKGLYIGTGGDIKVDMDASGTAITFKNVPDGTFLWLRVSRVYLTGTTASNIVSLHYV